MPRSGGKRLVGVRFSRRSNDRGGQAPALRKKTVHERSRGTGPRATKKNGPPHRRAWALACHTRMRAGFPRHASVDRSIAGDRPPRYGIPMRFFRGDRPPRDDEKTAPFTVGRGPVPRRASIAVMPLQSIKASYVNTLKSCWKG